MNTDSTTRLLLIGILVCLIALVAQGFGDASSTAGRYTLTGMRAGAPVLIRTDTATGEVWKLELRGGGGTWELFREPSPREDADAESAAADPALPDPPMPPTSFDDDFGDSPELPGLDQPEQRKGPKVKFARPAARPPARPPAPPQVATSEQQLDSFLKAAVREDLPSEIRVWSVVQLGTSDDPRSTDALIDALDTKDPKVRAAAIEALEARDADPRVAQALSGIE